MCLCLGADLWTCQQCYIRAGQNIKWFIKNYIVSITHADYKNEFKNLI